ncbi:MAG: UvrD-helicase domain-containing protein, partial [Proteobacteria bacterium]|nr:UvrD-helicase domain-containing protein [Pseudomonadota bacterium]
MRTGRQGRLGQGRGAMARRPQLGRRRDGQRRAGVARARPVRRCGAGRIVPRDRAAGIRRGRARPQRGIRRRRRRRRRGGGERMNAEGHTAPIDPYLDVPLEGLQLIEASAGTGKTYTLATLVTRLVIERSL